MQKLQAMIITRCRKSQTPGQMYKLLSLSYFSKRSYNYISSVMSRLATERKLKKRRLGKFVYYHATDKGLREAMDFIWKPIDQKINDMELEKLGMKKITHFTTHKKQRMKSEPIGVVVVR